MQNEPQHILLADDDETDRVLFTDAFAELEINIIVHTVNNGVELMKWLDQTHIVTPHLLFLDLNMPLKNGIQCLREIRSKENLNDMSIAIYSTSNSEKDIEETFYNGANIYITKPSNYETLKKILKKAVMSSYLYQRSDLKMENFLLKI